MTTAVNVAELKNRLSEFLAQVERGSALIVCRRNVPVARIEPIPKPHARKPRRRVVGRMKGTIQIRGSLDVPPHHRRDHSRGSQPAAAYSP